MEAECFQFFTFSWVWLLSPSQPYFCSMRSQDWFEVITQVHTGMTKLFSWNEPMLAFKEETEKAQNWLYLVGILVTIGLISSYCPCQKRRETQIVFKFFEISLRKSFWLYWNWIPGFFFQIIINRESSYRFEFFCVRNQADDSPRRITSKLLLIQAISILKESVKLWLFSRYYIMYHQFLREFDENNSSHLCLTAGIHCWWGAYWIFSWCIFTLSVLRK